VKEDEMDKACGMHGEEEKCIKCSGGKPKEKHHMQDLGTDGSIRLIWNLLPEDLLVSQEC